MTTPNINRLCRYIVLEHFGPIVEKVASTLLLRGRLNLFLLSEYCKVPKKQLRDSLFILIQHNLVSFADLPEGSKLVTYYSLEIANILNRILFMKILSLAKEKYGVEGLFIAKTFILNGKLKSKDVEFYLEDDLKSYGDAKVSDPKNFPSTPTLESSRKVLLNMVQSRFLTGMTPKDMVTKKDRDLEEDSKIIKSLGILPSDNVIKKALSSRDERRALDPQDIPIIGLKRGLATEDSMKNSRRRLGEYDVTESVDEDTYFYLNFQTVKVMIRNQKIVKFSEARINSGAAEVMRAFIASIENKICRFDSKPSPSVTGMDVKDYVDPKFDLESYIILPGVSQNKNGHSAKPSLLLLVNEFMKVLQSDEASFISRADDRSVGMFRINYEDIGTSLKLHVLENVIKKKFGSSSWRLFRVLLFNGLMDERQITKTALIQSTDVKSKLEELAVHKLVELQEIPRTADRAPSRAFYLWSVNLDRCFQELLSFIYRSIGTLLERRKWELKTRKVLLEKLEREDVKANQDILSAYDKNELDKINRILCYLDTSLQNLADLAVILQ